MWLTIGKILPDYLKKFNWQKEWEQALVYRAWKEAMAQFNHLNENNIKPLSFQKGVLLIYCANSIFANELRLNQIIFINQINREMRKDLVRELKFTPYDFLKK